MKRVSRLFLALALILTLCVGFSGVATADPGTQNGNSLSITYPSGGPYIHVTNLAPGEVDFNYGWNNVNAFDAAPLG